MVRIPELPSDSSERAAARRPAVRRQDRLPYHKNSHFAVGVLRQQLLSCGGPPQTSWSRRGQQQDQPRRFTRGVKRLLEFQDISFRECANRLLAAWCRTGTP
jgi:hypothetical protein